MQKNKALILFIVIISSLNISYAQDTVALGKMVSLKQCVDVAIKYNLQVWTNEYQMRTGRVQNQQAYDYLLPTLNGNLSQGANFGRSINSNNNQYVNSQVNYGNYGISSNLTIFSGLQILNGIKQTTYAYQASKLDWQQQKDNITLQVILAYLQVLGNQDILVINRSQATVDSNQVERLKIQNAEGAIAPADLANVQGLYAGDLANIAAAVNAVELAKVSLFQLMNIPYRRDVELERISLDAQMPNYPANPDSIYRMALDILPEIKSSDLKILSSQKALAVARGVYYPTLSLNAGVQSSYSSQAFNNVPGNFFNDTTQNYVTVSGSDYKVINPTQNFLEQKIPWNDQFKNNRGQYVQLTLSIPILNYMRARNNVKQAKINLENTRAISNNTRLQLQQQVEQSYQNMILAFNQYKSYQDQTAAYTEAFRAAEIKFNAGSITSDIYLLAKNNMDRATTNLAASRYVYLFRTKILDYYQGKLTW